MIHALILWALVVAIFFAIVGLGWTWAEKQRMKSMAEGLSRCDEEMQTVFKPKWR